MNDRIEQIECGSISNNAKRAVNEALADFAWYYGILAFSIVLTLFFGIYHYYENTDLTVSIFLVLLCAVFAFGHVVAMFSMVGRVNKARRAMNMNELSGLGALLWYISFFVLAWPLHILGIIHVFMLLNHNKKL